MRNSGPQASYREVADAAMLRIMEIERLGKMGTFEVERMPIVSIGFGTALIALGVWGYTASDVHSPTALIPAAVGVLLVLLGLLATIERFLKHAMHAAVLIALVGGIMAAWRFVTGAMKNLDLQNHATISTGGMTILCLLFVGLCVNSFIQVRRRRRAAGRAQTQMQN